MDRGRIAIIGGGNMGGAILHGLMKEHANPANILLVEIREQVRKEFDRRYKIATASAIEGRIGDYDAIILAVKPQDIEVLLSKLSPFMTPHNLVISVAAGISTAYIADRLQAQQPVARTMPNIAAQVGASAVAVCFNENVQESQKKLTRSIISSIGFAVEVDEGKMDAVTGLSGSGPAFVFLMIEALSDGGVLMGLSRETALALAVQTVYGAASMVGKTGEHPAVLRERVTSPGGTTAEGLFTLEKGGFRHLVSGAVRAAAEKSAAVGKKLGS